MTATDRDRDRDRDVFREALEDEARKLEELFRQRLRKIADEILAELADAIEAAQTTEPEPERPTVAQLMDNLEHSLTEAKAAAQRTLCPSCGLPCCTAGLCCYGEGCTDVTDA